MSDETKPKRWQEIARERLKRHGSLTMRTFEAACKRIAELQEAYEEIAGVCGQHPDISLEALLSFIDSVRAEARVSADALSAAYHAKKRIAELEQQCENWRAATELLDRTWRERIAELEDALAKEKECSDRLLSQLNAALRDVADLHEAKESGGG